MPWFRKPKQKLKADERRELPTDVFEKCPSCGEILYRARVEQNLQVCPSCGFHLRLDAAGYVRLLLDDDELEERDGDLRSADPLEFTDLKPYPQRLAAAERSSRYGDAVVTGTGTLDGLEVCLAVMDFSFIGGSMGSVVGEKIARIGRLALEERRPLIIVSASGGARMMEGVLSLMQMAKTSALLARLHEAGVPYVSILTDPTTGGVTASYAMLGDVIVAEPGALVGFAGPRVIEQTIKQALPEGFQRSEFLLEHGMIDAIVDRRQLKATLARLLRHMLGHPERVPDSAEQAAAGNAVMVDGKAPSGEETAAAGRRGSGDGKASGRKKKNSASRTAGSRSTGPAKGTGSRGSGGNAAGGASKRAAAPSTPEDAAGSEQD